MRNIIYAAYSKDLSVKTTTAKIQMMKQGKYVGGYAPYGYKMHNTERNKLAIDEDATVIVRRIFDMALDGKNTSQIETTLNNDNIPTPGQYFRSKYPNNNKFKRMSDKISWTVPMVYKVLVNYLHTGAMLSHKRRKVSISSKKTIPQEPIIVEGTHDAIVTKEEFEQAQAVIRGCIKNLQKTTSEYPLRSLVRCDNCKHVINREKRKTISDFYRCGHSIHDSNTKCPKDKLFEEIELERVVYNAIEQYVPLLEKQSIQNHSNGTICRDAISECMAQLRTLQAQEEQLKVAKLRLY